MASIHELLLNYYQSIVCVCTYLAGWVLAEIYRLLIEPLIARLSVSMEKYTIET